MIKLIAEIGWNHMGDIDLAKEMISKATESGADYCKFQTWSEKKLKPGPWDTDGRRDIYKKAELSDKDHVELIKYCSKKSTNFLTSIFNRDDIEFLSEICPEIIKIPSHEIYNIELISLVLEKFNKVLISTGAARWDEIIKIKQSFDTKKIIFMHCVSSYPCDPSKINLPRMEALKKLSQEIGYSGHYEGIEDSLAAICCGAKYIEKHFTIDKNLPGRDNKFAILPDELLALSDFRDLFNQMKIDKGLDLQDCELDTFNNYRGRWSKNE